MQRKRRNFFATMGGLGLATMGCTRKQAAVCPPCAGGGPTAGQGAQAEPEEYVWIAALTNLPLFVAHDHPALEQAGRELGVQVSIAGPSTLDIPALVATVEQVAARRPAGMMVVGFEPSALVAVINDAVDSGIPVVCVDADVPTSKRLSFIGTDWYDLGVRQAQAMVHALGGRKGKVALIGLIEQYIDQQAFAGFTSVARAAGLTVMEPQQDKGMISEAARVTSGILQANPDLVGIAGFDSESGPGMGQAIKEANMSGKIIATCVEAEPQHIQLVKEGALTACIGQKRELFTYQGVKALYDIVHSKLRFTGDDARVGISPVPVAFHTGTYTVTRENVAVFIKKT